MRYYISDLHFFHEALNEKMDRRGFSCVEEMNRYMIKKWNERVTDKDEVVILGDFSVGNAADTLTVLDKLKGKLCLILGNHDRFVENKQFPQSRFKWIRNYEELHDNGRKVVLCHYPVMCYNGQYRVDEEGREKVYMLYGHVHDTTDQRLIERFQEITRNTTVVDASGTQRRIPCHMINCFCKYSDYRPLSLDEWICLYQARESIQPLV